MRFYTNGAGGYYSHHALLDDVAISNIIEVNHSPDLYCSVQTYNADLTEESSQLVFDVDNSNLGEAYDIAISIKNDVAFMYDVDSTLWFSGSKGFHVVTPLTVQGAKANLAMRYVAHKFSDEIDDAMYKSRSLFRLPNTLNGKSNLYKIQVNDGETLASIKGRATNKQPMSGQVIVPDNTAFICDHAAAVLKLSRATTYQEQFICKTDWEKSLPSCVKALLHTGVPTGSRWALCFWLVRHIRLSGVDVDEAISIAHSIPLFKAAGYTDSMIRHYYMGIVRGVGCHGQLEDLLHSKCNLECPKSYGWGERMLGRWEHKI